MAFTYTGDNTSPGAAYAPIDGLVGPGPWSFAGPKREGAATADGFTSYKAQVGNPPRTGWGDYGAAAVDGKSIWSASQYIAHICAYPTWGGPSASLRQPPPDRRQGRLVDYSVRSRALLANRSLRSILSLPPV